MHPALLVIGGGVAWLAVSLAVGLVIGKIIKTADQRDAQARPSLRLVAS